MSKWIQSFLFSSKPGTTIMRIFTTFIKNYFLFPFAMLLFSCNGNQQQTAAPVANGLSANDTTRTTSTGSMPSFNKDSLTFEDAQWLVKSIYDTVSNESMTEESQDTITRTDGALKYHQDHSGKYYFYVVENQGPFYGASVGWCDVFIFKRTTDNWILSDFRLQAGGGGMYGNSGAFEELIQSGDETMSIVLSGGQTHMGSNFNVTLVPVNRGKIGQTCFLTTYHEYESVSEDGTNECSENKYHFKRNNNAVNYDLFIEKYNCLQDSSRRVDSILIPFQNGYKIPDRFMFES